jgi:hypothetical protein
VDVHRQNEANERDRTEDADDTVRAYACAEKPYFESLRLGHELSPFAPTRPPSRACIGATVASGDNDVQRENEKTFDFNVLCLPPGVLHSRQKSADALPPASLYR